MCIRDSGMGHLLSVTDQNNNTVKYSYDLKGNLLDETTADGKTTVYTYDDDNNLIKVKDPSGYVTVMTYDGNGNILTVTGPNGETNSYTYNVKNLLETQTEYTSARKTIPTIRTDRYLPRLSKDLASGLTVIPTAK